MSGAGKGGTGVDIKADDAYVAVAPSVHPRTRQRYQWVSPLSRELTPLPRYWVERLREPERPIRISPISLQAASGCRYALGALRRQLAELLGAPEGTRNDTLNKSAFALGQFVGAGMLDEQSTAAVLEDAGQRIGLAPGEVRRSVASGLRAGAQHPRGSASHDRDEGEHKESHSEDDGGGNRLFVLARKNYRAEEKATRWPYLISEASRSTGSRGRNAGASRRTCALCGARRTLARTRRQTPTLTLGDR